jgi:acyl-CoA synthetase (AMP-forming)/AMP-acid ligase II
MAIEVSRPTALADLMVARAAATPSRRALVLPDEEVTYGELWDRAALTARALERLGLGPGQLVGLLMPNGVDFVELYVAAGLVGATVVPINIRYRRSELRYLMAHSRMSVLITSDAIRDHVDLFGLVGDALDGAADGDERTPGAPAVRHVVLSGPDRGRRDVEAMALDDLRAAAADEPRDIDSFTGRSGPEDPLMVLYTSGTTAAPKGCLITHRAVTDGWTNWAKAAQLAEGESMWVPCPFFHIAGIGPVVGAAVAGLTVVTSTHFDPDVAIAQIESEAPEHLFASFPPITFGILRHPKYDPDRFGFVRTLHNVAPPDTMRVIQQLVPAGAAVTNNFGMTEAAGFVTYTPPDLSADVRAETTGPPIAGVEVRIADPETLTERSAGEPGEIQFRGPNTFREYLHDPAATAATILEGGWVRTGDLGVLDAEGRLAYIGRIKEMLKVGGENVAPLEVEAHLSTHPAVQLAQVIGRPDERYGEVPVAFIELVAGAQATPDELIAHCRGALASFKVPREIRFVTEWPMSATKIQKRKLHDLLADHGR